MGLTARRAAVATLVGLSVIVAALALWKIKVVIALLFSGFIVAYMLKETGVIGVFGLITVAMLIVVIAMALFGPDVRGKALDTV